MKSPRPPLLVAAATGALVPALWLVVMSNALGAFGYILLMSFINPPFWIIPLAILAGIWGIAWFVLHLSGVPRPKSVAGLGIAALTWNALLTVYLIIGLSVEPPLWLFAIMSLAGAFACSATVYRSRNHRSRNEIGVVVIISGIVISFCVSVALSAHDKFLKVEEEAQRQSDMLRREIQKCDDGFAIIDGDEWQPRTIPVEAYRGCVSIEYQTIQGRIVEVSSYRKGEDIHQGCDRYICEDRDGFLLVWRDLNELKEARVHLDQRIVVHVSGVDFDEEDARQAVGLLRMATPKDRESLIKSLAESYAEQRFS
ncbi:hypothetical protein GCM10009800_11880 [Nocardiopsis rhodophaea]